MSLHQQNALIARLTRIIMKDGKKHSALRIIDDCLSILRNDHQISNPVEFTQSAIENAKPVVELKRYKVSGRALQIPVPCHPNRQESLALRFLRDAFRDRKEKGSGLKLANELVALSSRSGQTFQKREDLHRRAEQNRAFAHYMR